MKILVTGGAGFIGSNFLRMITRKYRSYTFINIDALTYAGDLANLADITHMPNYHFVCGSICEKPIVDKIMAGVDAVINFAAESHVDRSIEHAQAFVETNIAGTYVLLESARKFRVKQFIQVSTDEVYGSLGETGYFTEECPLKPNNPYAASKASADLLAMSYFKTYGLPVTISRCTNNFGPAQHPEKLIPKIILNALQNKPLPIYGDGLQVRDWLYVLDHCEAIDLILHRGMAGAVYNIGANRELTNKKLVENILHIMGKPLSLMQYTQDRPGHDRRYAIDSAKIRADLDWLPLYNFKEYLIKTVLWYQEKYLNMPEGKNT